MNINNYIVEMLISYDKEYSDTVTINYDINEVSEEIAICQAFERACLYETEVRHSIEFVKIEKQDIA